MITIAVLLLALNSYSIADPLTVEQNIALKSILLGWMGEQPLSSSALSDFIGYEPVKCGTPAALSIRQMVANASLDVQETYRAFTEQRFDQFAPLTAGSPGGHFLIHYASSGVHKPYQFGSQQDNDGNGVPDYIDSAGIILENVWTTEIGSLGYNEPPSDGFYPSGVDDRYDVYVFDIATGLGFSNVYGVTYQDSVFLVGQAIKATSFIVLENDYSSIDIYVDRPLAALRVTAAHEFFHAIQFGYDPGEFEFDEMLQEQRHHWLEMSAVWMEEQVYDDIDDYYYYLGWFANYTYLTLRTSRQTMYPGVVYQYAAMLWPLYLSEKFGQDIVRVIWEKCAEDAPKANAFQNAFEDAIVEVSNGEYNFGSALSEFYMWYYFTGARAIAGFGYEEAEYYPRIPEFPSEELGNIQTYTNLPLVDFSPDSIGFSNWPDYLGANYLRFIPENIDSMRFTLDGEVMRVKHHDRDTVDFVWNIRYAKRNPGTGVEMSENAFGNYQQFTISDIGQASEVIVVLMPYAESKYSWLHENVKYKFTVPDTSSRTVSLMAFQDPYPNPFKTDEASEVVFKFSVPEVVRQQVQLSVFTLAGEKIYSRFYGITETEPYGQDAETDRWISWDATNDSGSRVASGLYLVHLTVDDESRVFKVAVIE